MIQVDSVTRLYANFKQSRSELCRIRLGGVRDVFVRSGEYELLTSRVSVHRL